MHILVCGQNISPNVCWELVASREGNWMAEGQGWMRDLTFHVFPYT